MSGDEDNIDRIYELAQQALFVEFPTRNIDLETVPCDGNEFIHKSRLEEANLLCNQKEGAPDKLPEENEQKVMRQNARMSAAEFSRYAFRFSSETAKAYLQEKFPRQLTFPKNEPASVQKWCVFCLGSKLCSKIYKEKYKEPKEEIEGNPPFLSIVVHFNQNTAFTVLKHLRGWFLILGMEESIGKWIYAVFACIRKPINETCKKFLKIFYRDCKKRLKDCEESERCPLYLISAILEYYFCVKSDEIGPDLQTFLNLKI